MYHERRKGNGSPTAPLPTFIVVRIHLPKINSPSELDLNIDQKKLSLRSLSSSSTNYAVEINLPYLVNEDHEQNGSAKFDMMTKYLVVELPVMQ